MYFLDTIKRGVVCLPRVADGNAEGIYCLQYKRQETTAIGGPCIACGACISVGVRAGGSNLDLKLRAASQEGDCTPGAKQQMGSFWTMYVIGLFSEAHLVDLGGIHCAKAVRGEVAKQPGTPVHILHRQCSVFTMGSRATEPQTSFFLH